MRRRIVALAIVAGGLLAVPPAQAVTLRPCGTAQCGKLVRPLDPARPDGRKIGIAFRVYKARKHASGPPIVTVEGGPGYPSIGSTWEYHGIVGPLLDTRDLILVDNRGTGASALIDCRNVQGFGGRTSGAAFARMVGRCAHFIDARFGRGASGRFATAYASDDLAAVLRALKLRKVDLYGDSYGSYFAQDFVARHPELIHSLVLDSTYPRRGTDAWYGSSGAAMRQALEIVSTGAVGRLGELLARVRVAPIGGDTLDSDGSKARATVDPRALSDLVQDAGSDPLIYRELDASVRAALAGDDVPLLRLAAQANTWNHSPPDAAYFSRGLYLAVSCSDYPQRSGAPPSFAPFTAHEWTSVSGFTQPYDVCADWPRHTPPPLPRTKLGARVPVLIVGGDLDSLTPLGDAGEIARAVGGSARIVTLRNTVHVTSEGDNYLVEGMRCARRVIRSFWRGRVDDACAVAIPKLHTASYPRTLAEAQFGAATVAAEAFGDAIARRIYSLADRGPGLRGGTFETDGERFTLRGVKFVEDATVDGTGTWKASTGAVDASLTVNGTRVHVRWTQASPTATAIVGETVFTIPAP